MKLAILGRGGYAHCCLDVVRLRNMRGRDGDPPMYERDDEDKLPSPSMCGLVNGIGMNPARKETYLRLSGKGYQFINIIHPEARISGQAMSQNGVHVGPGAVVQSRSAIGMNSIIDGYVDHDCLIGDHVHVAPGAVLGGEVVVEHGAFIGIGAVILPRLTIGGGATVGAGAVVVRDVPVSAIVKGNPAR